eukprot:g7834.t1
MSDARAFPVSPVSTKHALDIGVERAEEQLSERFNKWRTENPYRPFRIYHLKLIFYLGLQIFEWISQAIVADEFWHAEEVGEERHRVTGSIFVACMILPWVIVAFVLTLGIPLPANPCPEFRFRNWFMFPIMLVYNLIGYAIVDVYVTSTRFVFEILRYLYHIMDDFFHGRSHTSELSVEKDLFIPPYRMRSYIFFRGVFQCAFESIPALGLLLYAILADYEEQAKGKAGTCLAITVISVLANFAKILRFRKETKLSIWEPATHALIAFRKHGWKESSRISSKVTATCGIEEFPWVDFYNDVYVSITLKPVPNDSLQYFKNVCRLVARTWHLQQFIASDISIADDGPLMVGHLTEAMRRNHGLKLLDLSHNIISNKGAVPLSELIGHSSTLTAVDISHNKIAEEGFSFLSNALKVNVYMKMLDVSYNPLGPSSGVDVGNVLRLNYTLTDLRLNQCRFKGASMDGIAKGLRVNRTLKKLWLRFNDIGPEGMEALSQALVQNNSLNQLALEGNHIGDKGIEHLCTIFPHNNSISTIELVSNGIGDSGALVLGDTIWRSDMLQYVYLSSNEIGDSGMRGLAEGVSKARVLLHLSVVCNHIGSEGVKHLAEALKKNTSLAELHLGGNQITDDGICALAEALKTNKSLKILSLENNPFGEEGVGCLCDTLRAHSYLESLIIDGNSLSATTIQRLKSLRSAKDEFRVAIRHKAIVIPGPSPVGETLSMNSMTRMTGDLETAEVPTSSAPNEPMDIPVMSSQYDHELRTTILAMENVTLGMESEVELSIIPRS